MIKKKVVFFNKVKADTYLVRSRHKNMPTYQTHTQYTRQSQSVTVTNWIFTLLTSMHFYPTVKLLALNRAKSYQHYAIPYLPFSNVHLATTNDTSASLLHLCLCLLQHCFYNHLILHPTLKKGKTHGGGRGTVCLVICKVGQMATSCGSK